MHDISQDIKLIQTQITFKRERDFCPMTNNQVRFDLRKLAKGRKESAAHDNASCSSYANDDTHDQTNLPRLSISSFVSWNLESRLSGSRM